MLQIEVNGKFLDLFPNTQMEIERESPILQFNEELKGGFSLPVNLKNSPANASTLEYSGELQKRVSKTGFDATIYDGQLFSLKGKLKIEKVSPNLHRNTKTDISAYLVTDAASFYQDAKDKRMRAVDVGGDRTFSGVGTPWYTSTFGVHVLNVAKSIGGPYDYAFFPVQNSLWGDDPGMTVDNDVMNKVYLTEFGMTIGPLLVPFPYLKYVLVQAVAEAGWTIEGDILDDADFVRTVMINFKAIDWAKFRAGGGSVYYLDHYASVTFNLQDHLPDISVPEFLIALKDRLGWRYDFNFTEKKITIHELKDLATAASKDFTAISSPIVPKTVIQEGKIYSLNNNFVVNNNKGIIEAEVDFQGYVDAVADLPAAGSGVNGHVYLVEEENNYYICQQDPGDEAIWLWEILAGNIYDYVPDGATDDITSQATTVEMVKFSNLMDFIPRIDAPGSWSGINGDVTWGVHLCFHIGFKSNKEDDDYPFGTHHLYDSIGLQHTQWSLAFKGRKTDGTEVGLYDRNWKPFLDMFVNTEEIILTAYPSLKEYLVLSLTDVITVAGVRMMIKTIRHSIPYKGKVELVCWRI